MSEDEKVAETFRRLKYPPAPDFDYEEELLSIMAKEISDAIDAELISKLRELE